MHIYIRMCKRKLPYKQISLMTEWNFCLEDMNVVQRSFTGIIRRMKRGWTSGSCFAMSALTHNILRSIDYERVKKTRTSNAKRLDAGLGEKIF